MSNCIEGEYETYGCANGHYFGIKIVGERYLKIMPFSQLMIIYPDGSAENIDFDRMDVKYWKKKAN